MARVNRATASISAERSNDRRPALPHAAAEGALCQKNAANGNGRAGQLFWGNIQFQKNYDQRASMITQTDVLTGISQIDAMFNVLRQTAESNVIDAIEDLVKNAGDHKLSRINVLDFASSTGLDEERSISAFLHATRIGLFELSWNVLCSPRTAASRASCLRFYLSKYLSRNAAVSAKCSLLSGALTSNRY
jgi:Family of unknown function (DUF5939)